ncbi:GAF and ANTAR domain-containing protein [Streptomyces sp. H27-D2]|uniref:GAF and ANTAR domain-containing protein n=1 Tax=Streptomyces sp. H27-D2 TaxID=3046304 RepID=UPI002DBBA2D1|nr:GAF and ANTAR domain-containing protein [Streptomyces sp. H27-D2]MEC4017000.1 GAF and ANTAR domain-containing protein [Streptomyces sp. H27-D2]
MDREQRLADTFVELADTLVNDFDVIDFLYQLATRCVELLEVTDAALMLALPGRDLNPAAVLAHRPELSDLLALNEREGPALDCYRGGVRVGPFDLLDGDAERWPTFTAQAREAGYTVGCALPLRLRQEVIGSLLLLHAGPGVLPEADVRLAQALADAATIGILHEQTIRRSTDLAAQLHMALHSRIAVEQAKGVLAVRGRMSVDEAFQTMRSHARHHQRRLSEVAREVIETGNLPEWAPRQSGVTGMPG